MTRNEQPVWARRQARWIGEQMEIDDGGPEPDRPELGLPGGPAETLGGREPADWNKGQMAITHGEPQPHIDPDRMADSETGPTGRRANPGGGQRWARSRTG